jgi:MFS family permease
MTAVGIPRDAALIYLAGLLRSVTMGVAGVTLVIYLVQAGISIGVTGFVVAVGVAGSAVATALVGLWGDAFGRRRTLAILAVLMAIGYAGVSTSTNLGSLIVVMFIGMVTGTGRDRSPAAALDQALLPGTTSPERRTWVLAWYNLALDTGHALGALAGATPAVLVDTWGFEPLRAHQVTFMVCAGLMLISMVPYLGLGARVELPKPSQVPLRAARLDPRSRRLVTRLSLLLGLNSLGSGFLNSALIAYWFFERYGVSEATVAMLFFAARMLNAGSHLAGAWLAQRIGLLNTMVVTHLPSSAFLMAAPVAPSATLAAGLFLAREALVEMDAPTRQSYIMAIVHPSERTLASSATTLSRNVSWIVGPALAGFAMQHTALSVPLFVGCGVKIAYDLLLYVSFRRIRPPEETVRESKVATG